MKGILGRKLGMTQVFTKSGILIPVTVIEVEPNIVTQIKTVETDGYNAIQLGFSTKREKLSNKPELGHYKKANTTPKRFLKEIRDVDATNYQMGQEIKVDIFETGEVVDVTGTSKGKGFQGSIKRHNFSRGPMSHGSQYHRGVGSLGTMKAMRVFKGKKLPGHMGHETVTIQNLEIVSIDIDNNIILVKGNVPGPKKSLVIIKTAIKHPDVINEKEELKKYDETSANEENAIAVEQVVETTVTENVAEVAKEELSQEEAA
jgi:large subunit ribosomal protein L3